jgi:ATP-binding cassette subfamily F protein 3
MPLLSAAGLSHAFGAEELFHDVNVSIESRDRIGLVGPNGAGKSTLLLALAGLLEPTGGAVTRQAGMTLGYLRQEAALTFAGRDNTVYEELLTVFSGLREQEAALGALEAAISAGDASSPTMEAYGRLLEQFEHAGGYRYPNEIKRVLLGLGFAPADWETPVLHLSGGQKTRVLLGRLLLEKPDLLILDEPTNHLDTAAVEWLENTLRRWDGALLVVSHDRYFLDRIANRIWDLTPSPVNPAQLTAYKGNYTSFARQRDEAQERAQRLFEEERARLEAEAEFIQRHLAGGQGDLARGRLRQLTRDLALVEQFGVVRMAEMRRGNLSWMEVGERGRMLSINEAIQQIRALRPPVGRPPRLAIHLEPADESERTVWRTGGATIGYSAPLFRTGPVKIERGHRVGLFGPNGSGKSTLLRTIRGEIEPLEGEIDMGGGVVVGYFAQAHEQLDPDRRVVDELLARRDMLTSEARSYLARYLFRGDDVFRPVRELSGGERGRLALALLGAEGANFLLLDEPTNHLDIPSQEALQDVLEAYEGTILLVSHDRYLINRLATHVWVIEQGRLVQTEGNYDAFVRRREREAEAAAAGPGIVDGPVLSTGAAEVVALLSDDSWFGKGPRDEPAPGGEGRRPKAGRRRRELEEAVLDAEDWLARVDEALDEVGEGDPERRADLMAEKAAAEEELTSLREALETLG